MKKSIFIIVSMSILMYWTINSSYAAENSNVRNDEKIVVGAIGVLPSSDSQTSNQPVSLSQEEQSVLVAKETQTPALLDQSAGMYASHTAFTACFSLGIVGGIVGSLGGYFVAGAALGCAAGWALTAVQCSDSGCD
jgi:hypothetical protein